MFQCCMHLATTEARSTENVPRASARLPPAEYNGSGLYACWHQPVTLSLQCMLVAP